MKIESDDKNKRPAGAGRQYLGNDSVDVGHTRL